MHAKHLVNSLLIQDGKYDMGKHHQRSRLEGISSKPKTTSCPGEDKVPPLPMVLPELHKFWPQMFSVLTWRLLLSVVAGH
jgi:hypothetical protein